MFLVEGEELLEANQMMTAAFVLALVVLCEDLRLICSRAVVVTTPWSEVKAVVGQASGHSVWMLWEALALMKWVASEQNPVSFLDPRGMTSHVQYQYLRQFSLVLAYQYL